MTDLHVPAKTGAPARFITFEGGEGVGKSTQVRRLVERLARNGIEAVRTREPGGTPNAESVRSFLLEGRSENWGAGSEAVLFAAARLDHVDQVVAPNLERGVWVVCDRFHDSTRAYQGLTGGVDEALIGALEVLALDGHAPDLTLVLDMNPEIAFERVARRGADSSLGTADRFEKEDLVWHKRLRENYLEIARANPGRCVVIDAGLDEAALANRIWSALEARFPELAEPEA